MLDYDALKNWQFPDVERQYGADDAMLYALAVGVGFDPMDERQLAFVNDTRPGTPLALPTLAVIVGYPGMWIRDARTGIDYSMVVHGEEGIEWHKPLPASGTVLAQHRITRVVDKGAGKGATVTYDKVLFDRETGDKLATVTHTTFCRGDGGFSRANGRTDASPPAAAQVPAREPDQVCELPTLPQQALIYRLLADRNPLHSDPAAAKKAGFERPILHGLGTYGVACHALLRSCCDYDPARLKSLFTRFSSPVYPGETIRFELYREGPTVFFRGRTKERDKIVLDYGRAEVRG
jgi:acyl dehydratase